MSKRNTRTHTLKSKIMTNLNNEFYIKNIGLIFFTSNLTFFIIYI